MTKSTDGGRATAWRWAVVIAGAVWAAACGSTTPAGPGPITPPPVAPPPLTTPPVIQSVSVTVQRVEVETPVTITAQVDDTDTNPQSLRYEWSANVGTFEGAGQAVTWRAAGGVVTPVDVVVTLTVVEPYQALENGALVTREHRVTRAAAPFRLHHSVAEISKMTVTFLVDYFGDSSVSPDACMVDFSDGCRGKREEYGNIVENRAKRIIYSAHATVTSVLVNEQRTSATVFAACGWEDAELLTPNDREFPEGICTLTAVYEANRWWLCSSHFKIPNSIHLGTTASASGGTLTGPTVAGGVNNFRKLAR